MEAKSSSVQTDLAGETIGSLPLHQPEMKGTEPQSPHLPVPPEATPTSAHQTESDGAELKLLHLLVSDGAELHLLSLPDPDEAKLPSVHLPTPDEAKLPSVHLPTPDEAKLPSVHLTTPVEGKLLSIHLPTPDEAQLPSIPLPTPDEEKLQAPECGRTFTRLFRKSFMIQHNKPSLMNMTGLEVTEGRITRRRGGRRLGQVIVYCIRTLILILMYYTCSIGLTFYQKKLFRDFKFPLTVVIVHLFMKFMLAGLFRATYTLVTGIPRVLLPWDVYWRRLLPPGAAAGIDIGLSQWSLEFITVALYTMSKSTALLFILIFAIVLKLEEMRCSVVILVLLIAGGLFLFTYKYTQFNLFGFILVIIASLLSGLRWTLSQLVMQKSELGLSNPIDMVYHIQPWMTVSLLPLAIIMEGTEIAASEYGFRFTDTNDTLYMWGRVMFGAVLAFFMEVSEYLVVCYTSSLTFSIAGVAKEIMTLSLAVYVYNEHLSTINLMGLVLCIIGITFHVVLKAMHPPKPLQQPISLSPAEGYQKVPLLSDMDGEEQEIYSR